MLNRDDFTRHFWAAFLGSSVAKDGQVKGFRQWCEQAVSGAYGIVAVECERAMQLGGSQDDALAAGVMKAREKIRYLREPEAEAPIPMEQVRELIAMVSEQLSAPSEWDRPKAAKRSVYTPLSQQDWDERRKKQLEAASEQAEKPE